MIIFDQYPGYLISQDLTTGVYESCCITMFSERDLLDIVQQPLVIIPSNNDNELIRFISGTIRFHNNGELLIYGSDLIMRLGSVFTSPAIPATTFLVADSVTSVLSTAPPEEPYGVPVTLHANAEYVFEGGSGASVLYIVSIYRRILNLSNMTITRRIPLVEDNDNQPEE